MAEGSQQTEDLSNTLRGGSDFCFDFYCNPCDEDGRHVEAVGFCTDCSDYLCEECYKYMYHHRPKVWRHHVLLDSQLMPKDSSSSRKVVSLDTCTETCQKHATDIDVKHVSDQSPCRIAGLVLMPNDKLVALDYDNKKIKVVDTCTQKVLSVLALESKPWNGTSVGNDKLAVTLPFAETVQILNLSAKGSISVSESIKSSGSCWGITYTGNMLWVSYDTIPPKVEALTMDGEVQHRITADVTVQEKLGNSTYLAVRPDGESIYFSGYRSKSIARISNTGKVLSDYKCEVLATIRGLHMAADGTLYVCTDAGNVFMLSTRSAKMMKVIDRSQISGAVRGITYNENTHQLYPGPCSDSRIDVVKLS